MVQVNEILNFLVARSAAPSSMGAQLERLKYGIHSAPDPFRARDDVESNLLHQATIIRCIDEFSARQEFSVTTRQRKAASAGYKVLDKMHKATRVAQGQIAISVLRAFHERGTSSEERGLVEVYSYLLSIGPDVVPAVKGDKLDLVQSFRQNTAKRARNLACEAYADAVLAMSNHVRIFNKKAS